VYKIFPYKKSVQNIVKKRHKIGTMHFFSIKLVYKIFPYKKSVQNIVKKKAWNWLKKKCTKYCQKKKAWN